MGACPECGIVHPGVRRGGAVCKDYYIGFLKDQLVIHLEVIDELRAQAFDLKARVSQLAADLAIAQERIKVYNLPSLTSLESMRLLAAHDQSR